jgi:lipid-A-disaccharide synthase-like uncharacterized protein
MEKIVKPIRKNVFPQKIETAGWVLLALLVVLSLPFNSFRLTLGIILGGAISVINFHLLSKNLTNFVVQDMNHIRASVIPRYFIRLAATALALYFIISRDIANVIGLVIGLSVIVIDIFITTVLTLVNKKFIEEL